MKRDFEEFDYDFRMDAQASAKRAKSINVDFEHSSEIGNIMFPRDQELESQMRLINEEGGPLGLKLKKTPSLLDLLQINLSLQRRQQQSTGVVVTHQNSSSPQDKKKATNFSASVLRIGEWEYSSRYECDLVVKCYFAKKKLVWEILQGSLKSKIEIQWSDIAGLRATFPENSPSVLEIELLRPPMFFKESNPQPRKHTIWQATSDFTGGQATIYRRHTLQFPYGTFEKHYQHLLQADNRLSMLSTKPLGEGKDYSPYFSSRFAPFSFHRQHEYYLSLMKKLNFSPLQNAKPTKAPYIRLPPLNEGDEQTFGTPSVASEPSNYYLSSFERMGDAGNRLSSSTSQCTSASDGPFQAENGTLDDISEYFQGDSSFDPEKAIEETEWVGLQGDGYETNGCFCIPSSEFVQLM